MYKNEEDRHMAETENLKKEILDLIRPILQSALGKSTLRTRNTKNPQKLPI